MPGNNNASSAPDCHVTCRGGGQDGVDDSPLTFVIVALERFSKSYIQSSSGCGGTADITGLASSTTLAMAAILARAGAHVSLLLHHLVFSFPSPNTTFPGDTFGSAGQNGKNKSDFGIMEGLEGLVDEPGEPRALAGGVGPLSFVGSGYGVMLVLMVSEKAI